MSSVLADRVIGFGPWDVDPRLSSQWDANTLVLMSQSLIVVLLVDSKFSVMIQDRVYRISVRNKFNFGIEVRTVDFLLQDTVGTIRGGVVQRAVSCWLAIRSDILWDSGASAAFAAGTSSFWVASFFNTLVLPLNPM